MMALPTKCQTPGAVYHTHISVTQSMPPRRSVITAKVDLPFRLNIDEAEAEQLEANIHNVLELVLAPYFVGDETPANS